MLPDVSSLFVRTSTIPLPAKAPMQGARCALGVIVLALFSCSQRQEPRPPSTVGHNDVAGRDGADGLDDDSDDATTPAPGTLGEGGNQRIRSFAEAKRTLGQIYEKHRIDLYCGCSFSPEAEPAKHGLRVELATCGYVVARDATRAGRIEWEHAVAAATFGRTFSEWTSGDGRCVDPHGKRFKGRKCAGKSREFARMEGDLHNLFPVVGEVNGLRGDLPMGVLDPPDRTHHTPSTDVFTFGACKSIIERGVFLPRPEVRGDLARAALYMDRAYPSRHILDEEHRSLFQVWSATDPPDDWERERNRVISERQGNGNPFIR
jgi:deoxyribonuclease-1